MKNSMCKAATNSDGLWKIVISIKKGNPLKKMYSIPQNYDITVKQQKDKLNLLIIESLFITLILYSGSFVKTTIFKFLMNHVLPVT